MISRGHAHEMPSHNFITQQYAPREIALHLMQVKEHGEEGCLTFRSEQFWKNIEKGLDVIGNNNSYSTITAYTRLPSKIEHLLKKSVHIGKGEEL